MFCPTTNCGIGSFRSAARCFMALEMASTCRVQRCRRECAALDGYGIAKCSCSHTLIPNIASETRNEQTNTQKLLRTFCAHLLYQQHVEFLLVSDLKAEHLVRLLPPHCHAGYHVASTQVHCNFTGFGRPPGVFFSQNHFPLIKNMVIILRIHVNWQDARLLPAKLPRWSALNRSST